MSDPVTPKPEPPEFEDVVAALLKVDPTGIAVKATKKAKRPSSSASD